LLRRGAEYPDCHRRSEISIVGTQTSRFMAEPLFSQAWSLAGEYRSISRYLFFCFFLFARRAWPSLFHA